MATKITVHEGDDYCIIWKDQEQIFCYHGSVSSCVHAVCKSLGIEYESADAEEGEFNWGNVTGAALDEFNETVRESRAKTTDQEIRELEAKLSAKRRKLTGLKRR